MYTTRVSGHADAAPAAVYRALLDPAAIARWRVPAGMSSHVHEFEAREGGVFRVSLTYDTADGAGKSGGHTDTYHGRFVRLVTDALVVEEMEFEAPDPAMRGVMTMTTTVAASDAGGTDVVMVHEGVPDVIAPADNETGARMALTNLCRHAETHGA